MSAPTLEGKSLIITGAASGIGAAAAGLAAARGARVTAADRDADRGAAVVDSIRAGGGEAHFIATDIADEAAVVTLVDSAMSRYGGLDGAFNNAGLPAYSHRPGNGPTSLADMTAQILRHSLDVNVVGTFLCMKYEIRAMLQSGGGSVVNTSSDAGILAVPSAADYVSSKHAVIGLTKAGALDYATQDVRVNAIVPGVTRTGMMAEAFTEHPHLEDWAAEVQPNKRLADPTEIAEAALWLMSDAASFVTGSTLVVDGGYSMV